MKPATISLKDIILILGFILQLVAVIITVNARFETLNREVGEVKTEISFLKSFYLQNIQESKK